MTTPERVGEALVVVDGGDHDGRAGGGRERAAEDDGLTVVTGGVDSITTGAADLPSVTVDPGERRDATRSDHAPANALRYR